MRSRAVWKQCCAEADIWFDECGSLLNAHNDDEVAVIEEFVASNKDIRDCEMLTAYETLQKSAVTNPKGLKASLWSPSEIIVDPREAIAKLPGYLNSKYGIEFNFGKTVTEVESNAAYTGKKKHEADLIFICNGADFETLYPDVFINAGVTKCKLQMMRTVPQDDDWLVGPALSAGLTLTHYGAFANCPSLEKLKARFKEEMPEYVKWGIHVMLAQNGLGEVSIGDSHEYGMALDPFDRDEINQLIIYYLHQFSQLQNLEIAQTWNGTYLKIPGKTELVTSPEAGVHIINSMSGAGMTLSFGLAEEVVGSV